MKTILILSCEHAGNNIPEEYKHLFVQAKEVLLSHRGWDPHSKQIGLELSKNLGSEVYMTETSRLLVECNRSLHNPQLFSEFTENLSLETKEDILKRYYHPYRDRVEEEIRRRMKYSRVLHVSVHSFTPIWEGLKRSTDIGLLFDEKRPDELSLAMGWKTDLEELLPMLQIDLNKPYLGSDDGFTTYLRNQFDSERYLGFEIEVSQKFKGKEMIQEIASALSASLNRIINSSHYS